MNTARISHHTSQRRDDIRAALRLLDVERFVLSIHDQSFPSEPEEESGWGSPYTRGGEAFLRFVSEMGFNAVQLGPQGIVSRSDPSPYTSSLFGGNPLSLSPHALAHMNLTAELLSPNDGDFQADRVGVGADGQCDIPAAWRYTDALLDHLHNRFAEHKENHTGLTEELRKATFSGRRSSCDWPARYTLYEILTTLGNHDDFRQWNHSPYRPIDKRMYATTPITREVRLRMSRLRTSWAPVAERFLLSQLLLQLQHDRLRKLLNTLGMLLFGDAQIGFSNRDFWAWRGLFLRDYLMGAPPSRSNPEGQPWGYAVLDPEHMRPGKAGMRLLKARFESMLSRYDGLRIDHPHGLVCPWVYRADDPDPFHAVRTGARLNCAPHLADHPDLARYAAIRAEQVDGSGGLTRWDDEYVREMEPGQVSAFGRVLEMILRTARDHGQPESSIMCEVLSTWPAPLRAVMNRHGLGRLCVTGKARPDNPDDPYRSENTGPNDWIMVGNHDTPPLRHMVKSFGSRRRRERAGLLALHLGDTAEERERLTTLFASDTNAFCQGMLTELFVAPARNVSVFFPDLFGMADRYNTPGTVGPHNWTLRVPSDFRNVYARQRRRGKAFDVAATLAGALRVRFRGFLESDGLALASRLERDSNSPAPAKLLFRPRG